MNSDSGESFRELAAITDIEPLRKIFENIIAFFVDQQDARCADFLVDLRAFFLRRLGRLRTLRDGRSPWWLTSADLCPNSRKCSRIGAFGQFRAGFNG